MQLVFHDTTRITDTVYIRDTLNMPTYPPIGGIYSLTACHDSVSADVYTLQDSVLYTTKFTELNRGCFTIRYSGGDTLYYSTWNSTISDTTTSLVSFYGGITTWRKPFVAITLGDFIGAVCVTPDGKVSILSGYRIPVGGFIDFIGDVFGGN